MKAGDSEHREVGDIEHLAADWALRQARGLSADEIKELGEWLASDDRHEQVFREMEATSRMLDGIISTGTHVAQFQLTTAINDRLTTRLAGRGMYFAEDSEQKFFTTPGFSNRYNPATGELTQDYTWARYPATGEYVATFSP